MNTEPILTVSSTIGDDGFRLTWDAVQQSLESAEMYWITSLDDGEPHTVPLIGVWYEGAWYSCNPRSEKKYANLTANPVCQVLTGCSTLGPGMDIMVHGRAEEMPEMADRLRYGRQMAEKYPEPWRFEGTEEDMWVYRVVPTYVRAFHRLEPMSFARWDFPAGDDEG